MSNNLGLVELLLVLAAAAAWGVFELRSLRRPKASKTIPTDADAKTPDA